MRNFSATSNHSELLLTQSILQARLHQHKTAPLEPNSAGKLVMVADSDCVIVREIIPDLITFVESATIGLKLTPLWKEETENKSDRNRLLRIPMTYLLKKNTRSFVSGSLNTSTLNMLQRNASGKERKIDVGNRRTQTVSWRGIRE